MSQGNDPTPHEDLHDLEPLEPMASLSPIPAPPAAGAQAAAKGGKQSRELERAPMMLRKAAAILIFACLLPWMRPGGFDNVWVLVAKLIVLAGGGILYYSVLARHGESVPPPFSSIAKMHNRALDALGWIVILVGILPVVDGGPNAASGAAEKAALAIGLAVYMQILNYEKGGKLNPVLGLIIPLVGIGALGRMVTLFRTFELFAFLGCLGVIAASAVAGRTLQVAMKEAKAHGEAKKLALVEARKAARSEKRAVRGGPPAGAPPPGE